MVARRFNSAPVADTAERLADVNAPRKPSAANTRPSTGSAASRPNGRGAGHPN